MSEWRAKKENPPPGTTEQDAPKAIARDPETGLPLDDEDEIMAESEVNENDLMHVASNTDTNDYGTLSFEQLLKHGDDIFFGDHDYRLDDAPKEEDVLKGMSKQEQTKELARVALQTKRGEVFDKLRSELDEQVCFGQQSKFRQLSKYTQNIH